MNMRIRLIGVFLCAVAGAASAETDTLPAKGELHMTVASLLPCPWSLLEVGVRDFNLNAVTSPMGR